MHDIASGGFEILEMPADRLDRLVQMLKGVIAALPDHETATPGIETFGDAGVDHLVPALQKQCCRRAVARIGDTLVPGAVDE
jgi:hypothetical protein